MIVVDSSVWITNLRDLDTAPVRRLRAIDHTTEPVLVGDLILLEVLQGARDEQHASRIEQALRRFPGQPMPDADLAVRAARNVRSLRARVELSNFIRSAPCRLVFGHSLSSLRSIVKRNAAALRMA